jgi:exopolysaccharide biosynthesis protein
MWKIGHATFEDDVYKSQSFMCGFDWLIYDGENIANKNISLIAPRTAIGLTADGKFVTFYVTGAQDFYLGTTLYQTAEWMLELSGIADIRYAINLDGGGSSTVFWKEWGGLVGCPTCIDLPICCERPVTSISCVTDETMPNP